MYAAHYRIMTLILITTAAIAVGCRGSRKFGRQVQISQSDDFELSEIDSPVQRLGTLQQSGLDDQGRTGTAELKDADELETRTASLKTRTANSDPGISDTDQGNADSAARIAQTIGSQASGEADVAGLAAESSQVAKSESNAGMLDVLEEMNRLPPEERERIRRQLKNELQSADRTTQPNAIDLASGTMDRLPELPAARNTTPDVTPSRIGHGAGSLNGSVAASLTDVPSAPLSEDEKEAVAQKLLRNYAEAASSGGEANRDQRSVQTVSATQKDGAHSRIVQAFSPDLLSELSQDVLYDALAQQLSKVPEGEESAERSARLIRLRHLLVLSGNPDAAVEKIDGLSEAEQEYLRHQLLGLWMIIDPDGHPTSPSRRFTSAVPQIREAAKFAAAAADALEIRSLAFCTDIQSYGQFKAFEGNRFDSGQQVILYCEIDNFTAKTVEGGFETHLQGSYDIYDGENRKVLSQLLPADQQVSANYLRDYFIAYQMLMPQELPAGTYKLRLTMEDRNGKKYGNADIPFEIAK
jgi:hypothetical protein